MATMKKPMSKSQPKHPSSSQKVAVKVLKTQKQEKAMAARGGVKPISKAARDKDNARRRKEGGYEFTMRGKVKTPKGFAYGGKTGP